MKHLKLVALLALIIGCSCGKHLEVLEVKAIDILPPGGDVDSVTAYVNIQGAGIVRLDWERRAYGMDSLVQVEYWYVDSSDVYTSTLSVTDGWYWLSIYDEDSVLLATSDIIFCGTGSQLPPIANFYGEPTEGKIPLHVVFYDQSLNNPTSRFWKVESHVVYPEHTADTVWVGFDNPWDSGFHDVTLIVSNVAGADTLTKKNYIHAIPGNPPVADFYAEPTEGKVPLYVEFHNQSIVEEYLITCTWDYGDGEHSTTTASEHSHDYRSEGIYTVSLIIRDNWGTDTLIREDYITVARDPNKPVADFYAEPTEGTVPLSVHFHNLSTGDQIWRCTWDYGDGTQDIIDGLYGPYHRYLKEGIFTVTLTIFDTHGADQMTKEDYIHVNP